MKNIYLVFGSLIFIAILGVVIFKTYASYDRSEKTRLTLEWSNMNELPTDASNISAIKKGSAFTREFIVTFTAPEASIREWIDTSKGTSAINPEIDEQTETYSIEPSGDAQFAELVYDVANGKVTIRVYWS